VPIDLDNLVQGEYIGAMKNQQLTERLIVMVDKPTRKSLDKISNETGASLAYVVRRALDQYIKRIK
jgi:predicted DNA-binding protein